MVDYFGRTLYGKITTNSVIYVPMLQKPFTSEEAYSYMDVENVNKANFNDYFIQDLKVKSQRRFHTDEKGFKDDTHVALRVICDWDWPLV